MHQLKKKIKIIQFILRYISMSDILSTIYKRVTRAWYINYDLIHLYDKNFSFILRNSVLDIAESFNVYHAYLTLLGNCN